MRSNFTFYPENTGPSMSYKYTTYKSQHTFHFVIINAVAQFWNFIRCILYLPTYCKWQLRHLFCHCKTFFREHSQYFSSLCSMPIPLFRFFFFLIAVALCVHCPAPIFVSVRFYCNNASLLRSLNNSDLLIFMNLQMTLVWLVWPFLLALAWDTYVNVFCFWLM